ncbi:caveolae-associated protein 2-like [Brienomyrus brachyistius]|uniref:caveolae-associated protein 2-like n=1 Tax=Brienomyrus brachyistius TaxID=42636 RepID=UPI0020B3CF16|nr:caveolae-associated protein 2-like [Brienomyrus brachyistius]
MGEDAVQAERSSATPHESQDLVVPSPSPTQMSPTVPGGVPVGESTAAKKDNNGDTQVNAITVLTLLDKLVNMLDTVQENQQKMEQQQLDMESVVRGIQTDMTKLSKSHTSTSNTVSKLMEKSRKVSVHMKEVKDKMDKQAIQVKKLEANHSHLLKRNNFKVLIFQEENEIPATAFVKDPVPYPRDAEEEVPMVDANHSQEEGLQTINLSSDEELGLDEEDDDSVIGEKMDETMQKSRAEKIKRSSLKKVDSLKKAFSRQNIEKKMNKISTKISTSVAIEKREKLKQSNPSAKSSSFKVPTLSFGLKKTQDTQASPKAEEPPAVVAAVEMAPIKSLDENLPFTEVHSDLAPALEDALTNSSIHIDAEQSLAEDEDHEYTLSATLPQEDSLPRHSSALHQLDEEKEQEEQEEEEEEEKK